MEGEVADSTGSSRWPPLVFDFFRDDEEPLARADEPQLFASNPLDSTRIRPQPPRMVSERRVLTLELRDRAGELAVLAPGLHALN